MINCKFRHSSKSRGGGADDKGERNREGIYGTCQITLRNIGTLRKLLPYKYKNVRNRPEIPEEKTRRIWSQREVLIKTVQKLREIFKCGSQPT